VEHLWEDAPTVTPAVLDDYKTTFVQSIISKTSSGKQKLQKNATNCTKQFLFFWGGGEGRNPGTTIQ